MIVVSGECGPFGLEGPREVERNSKWAEADGYPVPKNCDEKARCFKRLKGKVGSVNCVGAIRAQGKGDDVCAETHSWPSEDRSRNRFLINSHVPPTSRDLDAFDAVGLVQRW